MLDGTDREAAAQKWRGRTAVIRRREREWRNRGGGIRARVKQVLCVPVFSCVLDTSKKLLGMFFEACCGVPRLV